MAMQKAQRPSLGDATARPRLPAPAPAPSRRERSAPAHKGAPQTGALQTNGAGLGKGERTVLIAIAQHSDGVTLQQLTVLTGYKRSSRNTYLQRLRASGYVDQRGERVLATDAGISWLGADYEPLPTGPDLRRHWLERLPEGEAKILRLVCEAYPAQLERDQLDEATGYKRSSRNTYLQRLIARGLLETVGRDEIKASETLFSN
jgi:hypothetical protein